MGLRWRCPTSCRRICELPELISWICVTSGFVVTAVALVGCYLPNPWSASASPRAQGGPPKTLHEPLDQILDVNVRDGLVYYRALRAGRAQLDRYAASLNVPAATYQGWSREQQMAFWVNAYNAFVLQTVIDHYPINGASRSYPANSVRQIPGAFEQTQASGGRAKRDARRDREEDPAAVQRAAPVSRARTGRGRQRPAAQRSLHRRIS